MSEPRLVGRCIGCFHPFETGPCGGCGAVEPCDGSCHLRPSGPCLRCESNIPLQRCTECRADGPSPDWVNRQKTLKPQSHAPKD
jgi:hypothetical protein